MNLKKLTLGLAGLALLSGAQTAAQAQQLSISTTWAFESEYVFRGVQFSDSSIQPDLSISYGNANLGAWAALPIGDEADNFSDEIDIYGGYGFSLTDVVSADVGFTYYTFPDFTNGFFDEDVNTFEIFTGFAFGVPLAPSVYFYYDFDLETFTVEGSAGYTFPITDTTSVVLGGYLGHVEPDGSDSSQYYGVTADVSYGFSDNSSGSIGVRWAGNSNDTFYGDFQGAATEDNSVWFGLSFGAGF